MRVIKNATTAYFETHPEELKPFPEQLGLAFNDTFHLGGGPETQGVDPDREGYPAGQAAGAIDSLIPAGELVRQIVAEAEATLERISLFR
jgi:enoyl-[acyl-carrier protein] reductase II